MQMPGSSNDQINHIDFSLKEILVITNKPGHQFTVSLDEHFRVLYISKGGAEFHFSDTDIPARAGDILYIPNETTYTSKWDASAASTCLLQK